MRQNRKQELVFKAAQSVWREHGEQSNWKMAAAAIMAALVRFAEYFVSSKMIKVEPESYNQNDRKKQLVILLNMSSVIRHFWQAIKSENTEKLALVLDSNHPIYSTADMRPWRTGKPYGPANKSHINYCVYDSTWETSPAFALDRHAAVAAWVKNDHLGFSVLYVVNGIVRRYYPDFIIRLSSGLHLVLEVKGQQTGEDNAKQACMKRWVEAVNADGRFGRWAFEVSRKPSTPDLSGIIEQHISCND